jgi:hypothetical protein
MIVFILIVFAAFLYDTLCWGLVMYKFWDWFLLPVFPELPALSFVQALGLMFVVGLFKNQYIQNIKSEYTNSNYGQFFWMPWATLFFGWLAHVIFF